MSRALSEPQFHKIAGRVFGLAFTDPDTPGRCKRQVLLWVEEGEALTDDEMGRVSAAVVAELVGSGCDVFSWGTIELEERP